ncbi:hypothetical protein [Nocardia inohanensis]|uniref:hypothetical protein n=1 Tax=Nocardia inohanensis TaxID=209246 RepID=UPI00082BFBFE|nr:hypothetical protein [Nocardia inohanensis]
MSVTTITLTAEDKSVVRTAAYGAISLLAAAGAPHKGNSRATIALTSATGAVGHVLAAKSRDIHLPGKTPAELADHVLPTLTAAMRLLDAQFPGEADNFRGTILVAVEAATAGQTQPAVSAMARKIIEALDAA